MRSPLKPPTLSFLLLADRHLAAGANWLLKADDTKLQFNYLVTDIDGLPKKNKKLPLRLQTIF